MAKEKETEIFDLYDLMLEQLRDLYDGEQQQLEALPTFNKKAFSFELREIIEWHEGETKRQLVRLDSIFNILQEQPEGEHCDGIKGLISEAYKLHARCQNPEVCDAALITAIQHINHYEIAGYGTAIAYAKALERHEVAELLLKSLGEERQADYGLSDLAEGQINPDAKWSSLIKKIESREEQKERPA
ncbi:ferritin-like domain-containing protein [Halalkalibaculum sp. DA3122]|uniref:YciE/YciF ferroxidase family protein n=1 Tax=Halalkalibaculum sp. DA3122 TaxID=3373607 RepID=UPI0037540159